MKILNIVGARPNLVKIAPLLKAMRSNSGINPVLVHTGQHYDEKLSGIFFEQMGIRRPDVNLDVGSGSQAWQTAEILKRIEPVLVEQNPDVLLVVGDVNSTMAASLAAAKFGIPIAHVARLQSVLSPIEQVLRWTWRRCERQRSCPKRYKTWSLPCKPTVAPVEVRRVIASTSDQFRRIRSSCYLW